MYCPVCGSQNAAGARLCNQCGTTMPVGILPPVPSQPAGSSSWKLWTGIACVVFFVTLIILTTKTTETPTLGGNARRVLPDVDASFKADRGAQRISNTQDEYALLVRLFGYPDSILSTENDKGKDKPIIPTRFARYSSAHVNVLLVPVGCVDGWLKAAEAYNNISRYPALAQNQIERLRANPCKPWSAWTIMGYSDPANQPISVEQAELLFGKLTTKRTTEPVEDLSGSSTTKQGTSKSERPELSLKKLQAAKDICEIVYHKVGEGVIDSLALARLTGVFGFRACSDSETAGCISATEKVIGECRRLGYYPPPR